MVFTASLLGARHLVEVEENNPASLLVVALGKALNGTPPLLCGRQVAQFSLRIEQGSATFYRQRAIWTRLPQQGDRWEPQQFYGA